jgi:hypothetical protein
VQCHASDRRLNPWDLSQTICAGLAARCGQQLDADPLLTYISFEMLS